MIFVARGDGPRRYRGRGGADGPSALRQGPRGLARGPHSFAVGSAGDAPTARRLAASASSAAAAEVKPSSYDAARRGRQVRRDARTLLKREEEKCVLPGRAAARARLLYQNLPIEGLASGRSRRRVVGRGGRLLLSLTSAAIDPKGAGSAVLVSYRPLALSQTESLFQTLL